MQYRLSICIPTLNRGDYIGETLQSIASQWEEGVEIVIVDGGSTDRTLEIAAAFTDRILSSATSNLTLDRQRGIDAAAFAAAH